MNRALLNHIDQLRHDALLCAFLSSGTPPLHDDPQEQDETILAFRGAVGYVATLGYMRMAIFNQQEEERHRKLHCGERRREKEIRAELAGIPVLEPDCDC